MEAMFYVSEDLFSSWVSPFQRGTNRREATKAMVSRGTEVSLSPVVRAVATEVTPARGKGKTAEPEYNADYLLRGPIVAAAKPVREASPNPASIHRFILDCGFHTRLEVRDITIQDPFDPSTHYTSKLRLREGELVELEGTLEAQSPGDHPPFTSTLHGRTRDIVPIARGIGVFMTVDITKAEPFRRVKSGAEGAHRPAGRQECARSH